MAVGCAVRPQLLEVDAVRDARLLGELAVGGALEVLVGEHEAARQRPRAREGLDASLDEQHVQGAVADREHDEVDGDARGREGFGHDATLPISSP